MIIKEQNKKEQEKIKNHLVRKICVKVRSLPRSFLMHSEKVKTLLLHCCPKIGSISFKIMKKLKSFLMGSL